MRMTSQLDLKYSEYKETDRSSIIFLPSVLLVFSERNYYLLFFYRGPWSLWVHKSGPRGTKVRESGTPDPVAPKCVQCGTFLEKLLEKYANREY